MGFFQSCCRICLSWSPNMSHIDRTTVGVINNLKAGLPVGKLPQGIPKWICASCSTKIRNVIELKCLIEKADDMFRMHLSTSFPPPDQNEVTAKPDVPHHKTGKSQSSQCTKTPKSPPKIPLKSQETVEKVLSVACSKPRPSLRHTTTDILKTKDDLDIMSDDDLISEIQSPTTSEPMRADILAEALSTLREWQGLRDKERPDETHSEINCPVGSRSNQKSLETLLAQQWGGGSESDPGVVPGNLDTKRSTSINKLEVFKKIYRIVHLSEEEQVMMLDEKTRSRKFQKLRYKCEMCAIGFSHSAQMDSHLKKHSPVSGPFQCPICLQHMDHSVKYNHQLVHSVRYECVKCGAIRPNRSGAVDHYFKLHGNLPISFECRACGEMSFSTSAYEAHTKKHIEKTMKCETCGIDLGDENALNDHMRKYHSNLKPFMCSECHAKFRLANNLLQHVVQAHDHKPKVLDAKGTNKNLSCFRVMDCTQNGKPDAFRKEEKHSKCDKCGRGSTTVTNPPKSPKKRLRLMRQSSSMQNLLGKDMPFACALCPATFTGNFDLKKHSIKHKVCRDFHCADCNIDFKTVTTLNVHLNNSKRHRMRAGSDLLKITKPVNYTAEETQIVEKNPPPKPRATHEPKALKYTVKVRALSAPSKDNLKTDDKIKKQVNPAMRRRRTNYRKVGF